MGHRLLAAVNRTADRAAQWAAVALGFSIPISVALDNMLLAIVLACWLASGAWRAKWDALRGNRVALAALALFGLLAVGTLYGDTHPGDARLYLGKYLDLLFIPVFAFVLRDAAVRRRALYALAASLALVLAMSYLIRAGLVPPQLGLRGNPNYPVFFKHSLTHNLMMAFGAFLFTQLALVATSRQMRLLWGTLAAAAVINVTLMVPGATGYLVLGLLALYLGYVWRGWRGLGWMAGAGAAAVLVLASIPGPFQQRIAQTQREIAEWKPGRADTQSSFGARLDFYRNSLAILREHPLAGVGTGGFPKAYADRVRGTQAYVTGNPHNEYLLMAIQVGIAGFLALLYLFWTQWRMAARLPAPLDCQLARGLVLMIAAGCLLNSLLLDHTEGLLYAWLTGLLFGGLKSPDDRVIE
jgi:O-antigen ligase